MSLAIESVDGRLVNRVSRPDSLTFGLLRVLRKIDPMKDGVGTPGISESLSAARAH